MKFKNEIEICWTLLNYSRTISYDFHANLNFRIFLNAIVILLDFREVEK